MESKVVELKKVCPRCGSEYSYIERRSVGGNIYYYAVHYYRDPSGKRRVRKCYLGPETYEYVTRTHVREGLTLKGMVDSERALAYIDALIKVIPQLKLDRNVRRKLARRFHRIAEELEKEE